MAQPYPRPRADGIQTFVQADLQNARAAREASLPQAVPVQNLIAQVKEALDNLSTQVNTLVTAALGNYYTKSQVDAADSSTLSSAQSYTNSLVTGAGGFTTAGGISAADLYTRNGPGFNITATRVAGWIQSADGRIGTASSSLRFKNILDENALAGEEMAKAILGCSVVFYNYKAEVAKRDDPDSEGYIGPDYKVHTEIGMIAEHLHSAGLWPFVVYERDQVWEERQVGTTDEGEPIMQNFMVDEKLRLDEAGEPIPFGIHYEMFSLAVLVAVQWLWGRIQDHESRIAAIENQLGITAAE